MAMRSNPIISKQDQCNQDINQLFTDLSTKLTDRKRVLLFKLDGIEKRYTAAKDNSKKLETMKIKQQTILASIKRMGGLITAETKQSLLEAFRQTDLSCNNWKTKIEEFSYICFRYHTTGSINRINRLGTIHVIARPFSEAILSDAGRTVDEDNFITRLNQCREQINQLFTDLSTKLTDRKRVLLLKLDGIKIEYSAAKDNSQKLETMKIKQQTILASIKRMGGLITAETKQSLEEAFRQPELSCNNCKAKIEEFSNICFKYDTTGTLNSIHQIGSITEVEKSDSEDVNGVKRIPTRSITPPRYPRNYTWNTEIFFKDICCSNPCCYFATIAISFFVCLILSIFGVAFTLKGLGL